MSDWWKTRPIFEIRRSIDDPTDNLLIYADGRIGGQVTDELRENDRPCLVINRIPIWVHQFVAEESGDNGVEEVAAAQ